EVVSDHHRHRPGGRRLGVEEQGGAARGLASGVVEHRGVEELVAGGAPGRLVAALHLAAARRHRLDEGADPGAAVAGEGAVAVGEGGAEPADDADPRALLGARLDPLDAAVLHGDGGAATLLDEHVGEVTATAQGAVEGGPQDRVVDHVITSGPAERFTGAATYNPAILRAGSRPRAAAMGPSQRAMIPPDD